jgi:hypothetical protein
MAPKPLNTVKTKRPSRKVTTRIDPTQKKPSPAKARQTKHQPKRHRTSRTQTVVRAQTADIPGDVILYLSTDAARELQTLTEPDGTPPSRKTKTDIILDAIHAELTTWLS